MEYIKYNNMAYNLHVLKTTNFKKVVIKVNFKRLFTKKDITLRNLLGEVLLESTKKYATRRAMVLETEDLYNAGYMYNNSSVGCYLVNSYFLTYLNDSYTEDGNGKKAIAFLNEILFNPFVSDGKFNHEAFLQCKDILRQRIESVNENPNALATRRLHEEMFAKTNYQYTGPGYIEDLDEITEASLYDYYKSVLNSDIVDIFVCGDVDASEICKDFKETFKVKTIKKPSISHIVKQEKFRKHEKVVKDTKDITQSILMLGLKIEPLEDFERKYVGHLYNYILGGGAESLLFKNVREKNSLCYSINSSYYSNNHYLIIKAGIDAANYKKSVNIIKKCLKEISEGNFNTEMIETYKMIFRTSREEMSDTPNSLIDFYQAREYVDLDLEDVAFKEIEKLSKDKIQAFSKKIKLDVIYLLEGGKKDEEDTSK